MLLQFSSNYLFFECMKTSHSIVFFVVILIAIAGVFFFVNSKSASQTKVLLQTMECQSDKIDQSVYNLQGNTSLIGAFIVFKKVPISEADRQIISDLNIKLDEKSWLMDYARAEIPTDSMCGLVNMDNVKKVFIPNI